MTLAEIGNERHDMSKQARFDPYVGLAGVGAGVSVGIFVYLTLQDEMYFDTAFEFDVKKSIIGGLSLTCGNIFLQVCGYRSSGNALWPMAIACSFLASFHGMALYLALPHEKLITSLVVSQSLFVAAQLGAGTGSCPETMAVI